MAFCWTGFCCTILAAAIGAVGFSREIGAAAWGATGGDTGGLDAADVATSSSTTAAMLPLWRFNKSIFRASSANPMLFSVFKACWNSLEAVGEVETTRTISCEAILNLLLHADGSI